MSVIVFADTIREFYVNWMSSITPTLVPQLVNNYEQKRARDIASNYSQVTISVLLEPLGVRSEL